MAIGSALKAVTSIGGAVLGGSSQNKAAKTAAASAERTAEMNNALAREFRDENTANLAPFMQRGNAAGDAINALLGLPTATPPQGGVYGGSPAQPATPQGPSIDDQVNYLAAQIGPKRTRQFQSYFGANPNLTPAQKLQYLQGIAHGGENALLSQYQGGGQAQPGRYGGVEGIAGMYGGGSPAQGFPTPQQAIPVGTVQSSVTPQSAMDGFRTYIDNSDYAFRQNEGNRGINAGYAANGLLESGAAMKALEKYRANLNAGYRGEYMGMLGNQQGIGLQGASAVAGVGQNALNTISANNNSAGSAAANAAIARGNANSNMYGQIAGGIGNLLGSSFGGGGGTTVPGYGLPGGASLPMPGYGNSLSGWG